MTTDSQLLKSNWFGRVVIFFPKFYRQAVRRVKHVQNQSGVLKAAWLQEQQLAEVAQ